MKRRYVIGFIFICCSVVCLLDLAFQISYRNTKVKLQSQSDIVEEAPLEPVLSADGSAQKNQGYYLRCENGYVVVYLSDQETVFQYTNILAEHLPITLQEEINQQKYISTAKELYAFLENYSS